MKVLGTQVALASGSTINASGDTGGGTVVVGGNFHGGGPEPNAQSTYVDANAVIKADALSSGDGGHAAIWSNQSTTFNGTVSARGGASGGNGGFVETSSPGKLSVGSTARVDTRARAGNPGTWLIDPTNIEVTTGSSSADTVIAPATIVTDLETSSLTLQADNDITVTKAIDAPGSVFVRPPAGNLTLQAGRNININADIKLYGGSFTATANDSTDSAHPKNRDGGTGSLAMAFGTTIDTTANGGNTISLSVGEHEKSFVAGTITAVTLNATGVTIGAVATTLQGPVTTSGRGQSYGGAVTLAGNVQLTDSHGGTITFSSTVTSDPGGNRALTVNTDGLTVFEGAVGKTRPLSSVSVTSGHLSVNSSVSAGTIFMRTTAADADITVNDDFTATAAGDSLVLVAARNFINNSRELNSGAGRWLVWSHDPASDRRGGLTYNFKQYGATYGGTSAAQATGNGVLYATSPAAFSPGLTGTASKVYDGTTTANLTAGNYTLSGTALDGDSVTLNTTTSGTYDTKNAGTGKIVTATGLSLSASNGSATVYGYNLASPNASGAIGTITRRPLTVTAAANSKTYDGTTTAAAAPTITSGSLVAGDTASWTEAYGNANAGTGKTLTASGSVNDGNSGNNYTIGFVNNTSGVINPAALAIAANNKSRTYGDANPTLTASYTGLVAGDTSSVVTGLNLSTSATSASSVGNYAIAASGASASNYTISYAPGMLTINPAALTIMADGKSNISGNPLPTFTASYSGFKLNDTSAVVSGLSPSTTATANSPAGAYAIILSGATASNYTITYVDGSLTVTAAPVAPPAASSATAVEPAIQAAMPVSALIASPGGAPSPTLGVGGGAVPSVGGPAVAGPAGPVTPISSSGMSGATAMANSFASAVLDGAAALPPAPAPLTWQGAGAVGGGSPTVGSSPNASPSSLPASSPGATSPDKK